MPIGLYLRKWQHCRLMSLIFPTISPKSSFSFVPQRNACIPSVPKVAGGSYPPSPSLEDVKFKPKPWLCGLSAHLTTLSPTVLLFESPHPLVWRLPPYVLAFPYCDPCHWSPSLIPRGISEMQFGRVYCSFAEIIADGIV